ncbi:MAG TPA: TonB-dependent receptor [SAR86 cluster bacterium]|nr:TonB-dependent receptor [SAR86 cluster bacterium]|tara:strand:- start:5411 stop:8290 length:2880 start_codon:yes stop_codon:yes gene_type:complete
MKKLAYLLTFSLFSLFIFAADEDSGGIDEVIVTAEKRAASIQDTAISITAFDESLIEGLNLRNQEDLQNYIPATTIQPYDISIRGVGRVFRALGGDPGVGTYNDGAYSEDFGIASTDNGLYDVERIEILRGPQGTLYGRNSIGGAVNFITTKPGDEWAAEIKTLVGSEGTAEFYSFVNQPLTDKLSARVIIVNRGRGGTVEDLGLGDDLDSYDDENYTLALRWQNDDLTVDLRGNSRSYGRVLSSAQGAGLIVTSEYGGPTRRNDLMVHGYRPVDKSVACGSMVDRTVANCTVPGMDVYTFNHKGIVKYAQNLVAGVDPTTSGFARPNYAYGYDQSILNATTIGDGSSVPNLKGSDLKAATNGFNDEYFNHSAGTINVAWDVRDDLTIKYIGSYTDYLYTRVTDDDRTGNPVLDEQFHAMQENENWQNEIQVFWDISDDWNLIAGVFEYHNEIDQDLDFWTGEGTENARYAAAADYGVAGIAAADATPFTQWYTAQAVYGPLVSSAPVVGASQTMVGPYSARDVGCGIVNLFGVVPTPDFSEEHLSATCFLEGPWTGENATLRNGPNPTDGTTFVWQTENKTDAYAVYFQTEYQINETWAITAGASWHEDQKVAEENLFTYTESELSPDKLLAYNVATGALNADGTPTGNGVIRFRGLPMSRSIHRAMARDFDDVTWRLNLDYSPTDNALWYLSRTTGYRAGGFNLGYFSARPTYDMETVESTELGYKGSFLENTLQINASAYSYIYENIHGQFAVESFLGGTSTSVWGFPEADTEGFEMDFVYAPTAELLVGGNFSFTDAKYSKELIDPLGNSGVIDENNPNAPSSVYSISERNVPIKGMRMQRIPEYKASVYANYTQDTSEGSIDYLIGYSWTDSILWDDSGLDLDTSPAFSRLDIKATWTNNEENLEIMAFVNNVANKIGVRNMTSDGEQLGYQRSITPTLPRMGGISFTYKFGAY